MAATQPIPTNPIPLNESVWPDLESDLILPAKTEAFAKHCMASLVKNFDPGVSPIQLIPHRGLSNLGKAIPDGCMEALRRATAGANEEAGNATELDPLWIDGEPWVMHDLTGDRQTSFQGPWRYQSHMQASKLGYIVRDVQGSTFTQDFVPTGHHVSSLLSCLWDLVSPNSAATLILDGRNEDAAKLVAFVSNRSWFHQNVVVQLYPYTFPDGNTFVEEVNRNNPAPDWKHTIAMIPVLNPDTLPWLARTDPYTVDYNDLYDAGKRWFQSMVDTNMKIFGFGFPASGIGDGFDPNTGETRDLSQDVVIEPRAKAAFIWDRVLMDLVTWAKKSYPGLAAVMVSITYGYAHHDTRYSFSFHNGHPVPWPKGAEGHGRELMSIPGNAMRLGADVVICDRMTDNLNAVLGTKKYSWPADVVAGGLRLDVVWRVVDSTTLHTTSRRRPPATRVRDEVPEWGLSSKTEQVTYAGQS